MQMADAMSFNGASLYLTALKKSNSFGLLLSLIDLDDYSSEVSISTPCQNAF